MYQVVTVYRCNVCVCRLIVCIVRCINVYVLYICHRSTCFCSWAIVCMCSSALMYVPLHVGHKHGTLYHFQVLEVCMVVLCSLLFSRDFGICWLGAMLASHAFLCAAWGWSRWSMGRWQRWPFLTWGGTQSKLGAAKWKGKHLARLESEFHLCTAWITWWMDNRTSC